MAVSQWVAAAIAVAGAIAALGLVIRGARGGSRIWAVVGIVLIALGVLGRFAYQWIADRYLGKIDDAVIVSILAADIAGSGVLICAGLLVATRAIVVAGRLPKL